MSSSLTCYAPLARLRKRQGSATIDAADDLYWIEKLRTASNEIDNATMRDECNFAPVLETHKFDWTSPTYVGFRSQTLLSSPLGAAPFGTVVKDGAGVTITSTAFIPVGNANDAVGPYYGFELDPTLGYLLYVTTKIRAISVTGVWGYHLDYANAFHSSGVTTQDSPLTSGATTILVSTNDSTIYDSWGHNWDTGTVQPGHLIQVDNEWIQVIRRVDSTHLQVIRGTNGTTPASHTIGTSILVYEAPEAIQEACVLYTAFLIARDGADFSKTTIPQAGGTVIPSGPPKDYWTKLAPYIKMRVA